MRTGGFVPAERGKASEEATVDGLQRIFIASLSARWSYTSGDIAFGPYRQGVRAAIIETFAWHKGRSVQETLYAIADVVLASYQEISEVTLSLEERPYRPVDLLELALEGDALFIAHDEPVGVAELSIKPRSASSVWGSAQVALACLCVVVFYAVLVSVRIDQHGVRWFVHFGEQFLSTSTTSNVITPSLGAQSPVGYDGQFYYALAADPVHARFYLTWAAGKLLGLGIGELLLAHFPLRAGDLAPRLQPKRTIGLGRDKLTDGPRAPAAG